MKTVAASAFALNAASDADLEQVVAALRSLYRPLHKPLAPALLDALRYALRRQELPKAAILVAAGCFPDRVYFLASGSAVAYDGPDRGDPVLWICRVGDFMLPDALLGREKSRYAAVMEQEGTVLSVAAETYRHFCEAYPDVPQLTALWLIAMRNREYERLAAIRSSASVAGRIQWLLHQWEDAFAVFSDAVLAGYLQTTREWLNKQKQEGFDLFKRNRTK